MTDFIEGDVDGEVFLLMTLGGMSEGEIDSHYSSKIENRKAPIKLVSFLVLFLAVCATLLFLFMGCNE